MRSLIPAIALFASLTVFAQDPAAQWTPPTKATVAWDSGDYAYDQSGNIARIGLDVFGYDGVQRLAASTVNAYGVSSSETFLYDRYGNLLETNASFQRPSEPPITRKSKSSVFTATNRIQQTCLDILPCQAWQYDDAGNQTVLGTQITYGWDAAGAMTELSGNSVHERYVYDANDERVLTVSLDGNTEVIRRWTWRDAANKVAREGVEHVSGKVWTEARDYVYRDGMLLAAFETPASAVAERNYHVDHLGTPRLITDAGRRKLAIEAYLPFGGRAPGGDTAWVGFHDRMRFTGHERDGEGSTLRPALDYMHARYYTPQWGRFLSVDPGVDWDASIPQSWNLYTYTRNNPVNATDPDGRQVFSHGGQANIKVNHFVVSVGWAANYDLTGNMSATLTGGVGLTTNAVGMGLQGTLAYANVERVEQLVGTSVIVGGGLGPASGDLGIDPKTLTPESVTLGVDPFAMLSGSGGVEGQVAVQETIEVFNMREFAGAAGRWMGETINEARKTLDEIEQQVKEFIDPSTVRQPPEPQR